MPTGKQLKLHTCLGMPGSENLVWGVFLSRSFGRAEHLLFANYDRNGVAHFNYKGNEYFIATNNTESAVSSHDAIVELVGITNIHNADNSGGLVTLHF